MYKFSDMDSKKQNIEVSTCKTLFPTEIDFCVGYFISTSKATEFINLVYFVYLCT